MNPTVVYRVSSSWNHRLLLHKYTVLCNYQHDNKTKYIVAPEYKTIWSSDGKDLGDRKCWDGVPKTHWDVFASLGDAKARLETILKSELYRSKGRLDKAKEETKALEQIKIENLPQDTYISPFTNQKA